MVMVGMGLGCGQWSRVELGSGQQFAVQFMHRDAHKGKLSADGISGAEVARSAQRSALRHHYFDQRHLDLVVGVARLSHVRLVWVRVGARPLVRLVRCGHAGSFTVAFGRAAAEAGLLASEDVGTAVAAGPVARFHNGSVTPIAVAHGDQRSGAAAGQRPEAAGKRPERRG